MNKYTIAARLTEAGATDAFVNEAKENANATRVVLTTLDAAQAEGEQA